MTGESDERRKEPYENCMKRHADKNHLSSKNTYHTSANEAHALPSPVVLSGTNIAGGDGRMISLVVGEASALGEILAKTKKRDQKTPL